MTYLEFKNKLRREIWPGGEPEKLKVAHDGHFLAAMIDLQKWVICLQANNTTVYQFCNTYWERYKTVLELPKARVRRIWTISNDDWEDRVWYQSGNFPEIERWADRLYQATKPDQTDLPALPLGFRYANTTTDYIDGVEVGRARTGIWAIHRRKLYVAPYLKSNEKLVVEWDGQKFDWKDDDLVDEKWWTQEVQEAVKSFVKWKHEWWYGEKPDGAAFKSDYDQQLADIIIDCRRKIEEQENEPISDLNGFVTQEMADDDAIVPATTDFITCFTADIGGGDNWDAVAAQMLAQNPGRIILGGDISYGAEYGTFLDNLALSIVYPALGDNDWDFDSTLAKYKTFFAATLKGNKRYYSHVYGPIQFFHIHGDSRDPDLEYVDATTSTESSIMGEWLRVQMALSTAKYKVVILHEAPFTSESTHTPGSRWMRWPFFTWGASLVLSGDGHCSEFIEGVDGMDYVVCGLGGRSIRSFGADTTGTILKQYNGNYGFLKLTCNCERLLVELINKEGVSIYTAEVTP